MATNGKRRRQSDEATTTPSTSDSPPINEGSSSSLQVHACKACRRMKRRCDKQGDRNQPCSYCSGKGQPCEPFDDDGSRRPRKKRFPEATLLATIKAYETALTANGIDVDAVKRAASIDLSSTAPDANHPDPLEEFDAVQSIVQGDQLVGGGQAGRNNDNAAHSSSLFSLPRDMPHRQAILKHFDESFSDDAATLLAFKDHTPGQALKHPTTMQIFKLWTIYTERIQPVCKVLHEPTVRDRIYAIGDDVNGKATPVDHALLFAMYLMAAFSVSAQELLAVFGRGAEGDVADILLDLATSTQTALARAGAFKSSQLGVLQALLLYLIPLQRFIDPRTFASYTALADRTARRLHIHRELRQARSPLEQEMRRRVWWEVLMLDARAVEKSGAGCGALAGNWNAKLPRPCNDADIVREGGASNEAEATPGSESFVFSIRCELAGFLATLRQRQGLHLGMTELSSVASMSLQEKRDAIDGLERRLEQKYLRHCDDVHVLTKLARVCARYFLSKMRLQAEIAHHQQDKKAQGSDHEPRTLDILSHCCDQIRLFADVRTSAALGARLFEWHWIQQMPFLAMLYAISLLRTHTTGKVVDDCWEALERCWSMWTFNEAAGSVREKVAEGPTGINGRACCLLAYGVQTRSSPFNILPPTRFKLFGTIIIPAWSARRAALAARDGIDAEAVPTPSFIKMFAPDSAGPIAADAGQGGPPQGNSGGINGSVNGGSPALSYGSATWPAAAPPTATMAPPPPPPIDDLDLDSILASFLGSGTSSTPQGYSDGLPSMSPNDAFSSFDGGQSDGVLWWDILNQS